MTDSPKDSIALLIDADNSPSSKIDFIISALASHGVVNIRRAYGNWTKRGLTGWSNPHFPALWSGPTAAPGPARQKQFLP